MAKKVKILKRSNPIKKKKSIGLGLTATVASNSKQLNYLYNLESRNMSSFARLAKRALDGTRSGSLKASIGSSFSNEEAPVKKASKKKATKKRAAKR